MLHDRVLIMAVSHWNLKTQQARITSRVYLYDVDSHYSVTNCKIFQSLEC